MPVFQDPDNGRFILTQEEAIFDVRTWCSDPDGQKPEQVHLRLPLEEPEVDILIRFHGPNVLNRLIDALINHRDELWPAVDR